MNIIVKKVDDLIPYENNPRDNDKAVDVVANSIKEFGFKVPIVVDKNNVIVTGHTRLKAAKKLGLDSVPVIVADDLTEEQIKAFRLADNKTSEFADWDFVSLEEELSKLELDMSQFGFHPFDEVEWDDVEDLSEKTYKEPTSKHLRCPKCGCIDYAIHFVAVNQEDKYTEGDQ